MWLSERYICIHRKCGRKKESKKISLQYIPDTQKAIKPSQAKYSKGARNNIPKFSTFYLKYVTSYKRNGILLSMCGYTQHAVDYTCVCVCSTFTYERKA